MRTYSYMRSFYLQKKEKNYLSDMVRIAYKSSVYTYQYVILSFNKMNGVFDSDYSNDLLRNELFDNPLPLRRSYSNDGFLTKLLSKQQEVQKKRHLILNIQNASEIHQKCIKVFKNKEKKIRKKGQGDYKKNICGYITKKIIREFISLTYKQIVKELCEKYGCEYEDTKGFYARKIERVTGPSHLPELFVPRKKEQIPIKKACGEFFSWFLKQRYIRYIILEGKMEKKYIYIRYKNHILSQIIQAQRQQDMPIAESKLADVE